MERHCIRCGQPLHGRSDKKFCCDDCRTDYHNELRRREEKGLRATNRILACNWRILLAEIREGHCRTTVERLAERNFNFEVYTAYQRRFPGRRTYWCYNCSYRISRSGAVHITTP